MKEAKVLRGPWSQGLHKQTWLDASVIIRSIDGYLQCPVRISGGCQDYLRARATRMFAYKLWLKPIKNIFTDRPRVVCYLYVKADGGTYRAKLAQSVQRQATG
jgi:hypothetical protein